jgi:hypothetical protein
MAQKFSSGIHHDLDLKFFLTSEKTIINTFLSKEWLITRGGELKFAKSTYRYVIAKPPVIYTDLFNLVREFVVLFSPFDEFQPRTIEAIDKIQNMFPLLRIERVHQ